MENNNKEETIQGITERTAKASSDYERTNTELKRKYLIWNIEAFNLVAKRVSTYRGTFGTGYPFYALNSKLEGELPIISEQIRYNRELVKDGRKFQKSIWECKSCLKRNYNIMPDLKTICKPCPNMMENFKPRKIMNRLPDIDMWIVCEDGDENIKKTEKELEELLGEIGMRTSDVEPLRTLDDVGEIAEDLKNGNNPKRFLPIDAHIIEYSKIKELIEQVPDELNFAEQEGKTAYLPIRPKSLRKHWQYDDAAYNFVYDYLSAFTPFDFPKELQDSLDISRAKVAREHSADELLGTLKDSATPANLRRFNSPDLIRYFKMRVTEWQNIQTINKESKSTENDEKIQNPKEEAKSQGGESYEDNNLEER